jgi:hypothetical protein
MKQRIAWGTLTVLALAVAGVSAGGALKSGPAVGEAIYNKERGPFHPLNCTGAKADEKNCLV